MAERLLKTVELVSRDDKVLGALSPTGNALSDVEIWTSRSKIVNEHLCNIRAPVQLVGIVDPLLVPIWSIVDKPYNVYTTNETTQLVFQNILNHSDCEDGISRCGLLAKLTPGGVYMLIYTEIETAPVVRCIILELNMSQLFTIISKDDLSTKDRFIDEQREMDLMELALHKRLQPFNNVESKKEAEIRKQEERLQFRKTKQEFKNIVTAEVMKKMKGHSRSEQSEVAEICYKAMSYRFKNVREITDRELLEILKWLKTMLEHISIPSSTVLTTSSTTI
ncbi:CYFA0S01e06392g1_1 [Cyberlindnera fabianii]|uniref:CYFA0S01e06392g1_1 n=1 Tax=Cyberlindnera fabianii TaxID=36022 RepID=A0A061AHH3_CYBFA|nr:CYFA0S01e06392g1_1 [Cyberlindnera fabianii]